MKKIVFYLIIVLLWSSLYGDECLKIEDIKQTIVHINEDEDKVVFRNKNENILKEVTFLNFVNTGERVLYRDLNFDNKKEILVNISSHEQREEHKVLTIGCDKLIDFSPSSLYYLNVEKLLSKAKEVSKEYLKESAEILDKIVADTKNYGKGRVAIISTYHIKSSSNPYRYALLSLYEKKASNAEPLLSNFRLSHTQGDSYSSTDDYYRATHQYKLKNSSDVSTLKFEHIYTFEHEQSVKKMVIKKWSVKLDSKIFVLKNGKYEAIKRKEKPIFDWDEVLKNAQKGLRYKKIVLEAMLFEEPISKENVKIYTQIGQAFKKAKHREEAEFLLNSILEARDISLKDKILKE